MIQDLLTILSQDDEIMDLGFSGFSISEEDMKEDKDILSDDDLIGILPVKNTVLFPGVVIPVTVTRDKSIKIVKEANRLKHKRIGIIAQRNPDTEDPTEKDLYQYGTIARIFRVFKMPDGSVTIVIQGKSRFKVTEFIQTKNAIKAKVAKVSDVIPPEKSAKALIRSLRAEASRVIDLSPQIPTEAKIALDNIDNLGLLCHFIASNLNVDVAKKQHILEIDDLKEKSEQVLRYLDSEINVLELSEEIQSKVKTDLDKQQREYMLRQQIRAIQDELGEAVHGSEIEEMKNRSLKKKWKKEVKAVFDKEITKLSRLTPQMPDYALTINYLEWLLDLPWGEFSTDVFNFRKSQLSLDKAHYGLEKVKERIMEYLAVLKLKQNKKAPILCFYGPPGVGKTSLAKSIADAIGRECVRISLGGVKDEAEIRGHRRTYIGAMPGKILQAMRRTKTNNPVFVLDEIDKVGNDFRGDPSSALLEVLDPEQNSTFQDHFLEVEYDLSQVMFIATANTLSTIHPALYDRLEIIEINGYTLDEKINIVKKHLLPLALEEHGLAKNSVKLNDKSIRHIIERYTKESGVRKLMQQLAALCRTIAKKIVMEDINGNVRITEQNVVDYLGQPKFELELYQKIDTCGVAIGMAWTPVGGDILFIESVLMPGNGKLSMTGQLGEIMQESANLAHIYLKSHAETLHIPHKVFTEWDVHIHFPAGAIPKDGPSAGVTVLTALASLYTRRKVKPHLAMSGEITLRGRVLAVGGIKEKVLAAVRAGIQTIILPKDNQKEVREIQVDAIQNIDFHYVEYMSEVLALALSEATNPDVSSFYPPNSTEVNQ